MGAAAAAAGRSVASARRGAVGPAAQSAALSFCFLASVLHAASPRWRRGQKKTYAQCKRRVLSGLRVICGKLAANAAILPREHRCASFSIQPAEDVSARSQSRPAPHERAPRAPPGTASKRSLETAEGRAQRPDQPLPRARPGTSSRGRSTTHQKATEATKSLRRREAKSGKMEWRAL